MKRQHRTSEHSQDDVRNGQIGIVFQKRTSPSQIRTLISEYPECTIAEGYDGTQAVVLVHVPKDKEQHFVDQFSELADVHRAFINAADVQAF